MKTARHNLGTTKATTITRSFPLKAESLRDAVVVDDVAADHGQQRPRVFQILVGDGEAVPVEHREVAAVSDLDRSKVVLPDEPLVRGRGEPEHLLTRQRLSAENRLPREVVAGDDGVEVQPRVDDGDVAAVGVVAFL